MRFNTYSNKKKKIGLIVYARMSSKRFPGKILVQLNRKDCLLAHIINNLQKSIFKNNIVVATSKFSVDKKIVNFCKKQKIRFFQGEHNDVHERTKQCLKKYKFDYFVRICADRPFFDVQIMEKMISLILKKNYDIVTNVCPRTVPKGLTCEVSKSNIFFEKKKLNKNERENIFNYYYKNSKYNIKNVQYNFSKNFVKKNFCIDRAKDLIKIKKIIKLFFNRKKQITSKSLFEYYET